MNERTARRTVLDDLYVLLDVLAERLGGPRRLAACTGRMSWPDHGVYFFFEEGELREDGRTARVVRVGTHALTAASRTKLWTRLRTHRGRIGGSYPGSGNHRASVFRLHVGNALHARDGWPTQATSWGRGTSASRDVRDAEVPLERAVSDHIGDMLLLWLPVQDRSDRGAIERGLIGLLSNLWREPIDPPSPTWLGNHSPHPKIAGSGLWNVNHVDDSADADVLELFERALAAGRWQ